MSTINTRYLGLDLSSPIIVGSSNFTSKVESIVEAEAAGAGAVVLKSLFEEQIVSQAHSMSPGNHTPRLTIICSITPGPTVLMLILTW
jgi:dihydroorotate dehydrogenase